MLDGLLPTYIFAIDQVAKISMVPMVNYLVELDDTKLRVAMHSNPDSMIDQGIPRANFDMLISSVPGTVVQNYRSTAHLIPTYRTIHALLAEFVKNNDIPMILPSLVDCGTNPNLSVLDPNTRFLYCNPNSGHLAIVPDRVLHSPTTNALKAVMEKGQSYNALFEVAGSQARYNTRTYTDTNYYLSRNDFVREETPEISPGDLFNSVSFITSLGVESSMLTMAMENIYKNSDSELFVELEHYLRMLVGFFNVNLPPLVTVRLLITNEGKFIFDSVRRLPPTVGIAGHVKDIQIEYLNQIILNNFGVPNE